MTAIFNIAIVKENNFFVAKCINNDVASQGKTMEEAINNLKEAVELYYEDETEYLPSDTSNLFLSTLIIDLPWQKNTPYYQGNKLWVSC